MFKTERAPEQEKVKELGGLCIIGTERHESRRIDNQLRGRSGRQGDPGATQFFISLEDELMRLFGGERMQGLVGRLGVDDSAALEAGMLTRSIENAQKKVEGRNFSVRKYVLQYDNVMNKQREIIYNERRKVLFGEDLKEHISSMVGELVDECVDPITVASKYPEEWDINSLEISLKRICHAFPSFKYSEEDRLDLTEDSLKDEILEKFDGLYAEKENEIGIDKMRDLERMILIRVVDNKWMDHIDAMDQLKSGIGLRALGQQDPAAAYAKEGFDMFELMVQSIKEDTVKFCYNVTVQTTTERKQVIMGGVSRKDDYSGDGAVDPEDAAGQPSDDGPGGGVPRRTAVPPREKKQETFKRDGAKVGRNDPCPCGSGKKYKNCCLNKE
jgi:preprotein translocase subunit SecA